MIHANKEPILSLCLALLKLAPRSLRELLHVGYVGPFKALAQCWVVWVVYTLYQSRQTMLDREGGKKRPHSPGGGYPQDVCTFTCLLVYSIMVA